MVEIILFYLSTIVRSFCTLTSDVLYLITTEEDIDPYMEELGSAKGESLCSEYDPFILQYSIIHAGFARSSDQVFDYLLFSIFDNHPMTNGLHSQYILKGINNPAFLAGLFHKLANLTLKP